MVRNRNSVIRDGMSAEGVNSKRLAVGNWQWGDLMGFVQVVLFKCEDKSIIIYYLKIKKYGD